MAKRPTKYPRVELKERTIQRLSLERLIQELSLPPATREFIVRDAELGGFGLRVTAGTKSFVVEYRDRTGKLRRETIGEWPAMSQAAARLKANEILGVRAASAPPPEPVQTPATFADILDVWFAHAAISKAPRSVREDVYYENCLIQDRCASHWFARPAESIKPLEIED